MLEQVPVPGQEKQTHGTREGGRWQADQRKSKEKGDRLFKVWGAGSEKPRPRKLFLSPAGLAPLLFQHFDVQQFFHYLSVFSFRKSLIGTPGFLSCRKSSHMSSSDLQEQQ